MERLVECKLSRYFLACFLGETSRPEKGVSQTIPVP